MNVHTDTGVHKHTRQYIQYTNISIYVRIYTYEHRVHKHTVHTNLHTNTQRYIQIQVCTYKHMKGQTHKKHRKGT